MPVSGNGSDGTVESLYPPTPNHLRLLEHLIEQYRVDDVRARRKTSSETCERRIETGVG
jgi:hypothetical protein